MRSKSPWLRRQKPLWAEDASIVGENVWATTRCLRKWFLMGRPKRIRFHFATTRQRGEWYRMFRGPGNTAKYLSKGLAITRITFCWPMMDALDALEVRLGGCFWVSVECEY
jgi:hypothetical protein